MVCVKLQLIINRISCFSLTISRVSFEGSPNGGMMTMSDGIIIVSASHLQYNDVNSFSGLVFA